MAFKILALATFLAVANASNLASYDIPTATGDYGNIGYTHESPTHVLTRAAPYGYAQAGPVSGHGNSYGYGYGHGQATPVNAKTAYATPYYAYAQAAPAHGTSYGYGQAAPSYRYAQADPVRGHGTSYGYGYAQGAPGISRTAYATPYYGYAQPAPVLAHRASHGYSHAAPYVTGYASGPDGYARFSGFGESYSW